MAISWITPPTRFLRREKDARRPRRVARSNGVGGPGWPGDRQEPTDVVKIDGGSQYEWVPNGSNFADLAAVKASAIGDGTGPPSGDMDTVGDYVLLADGSQTHYRSGQWFAGAAP